MKLALWELALWSFALPLAIVSWNLPVAMAEEEAATDVGADTPQFTAEQVQFFEDEVQPLLSKHCYKCHGPEEQNGELRLDHRSFAIRGGELGPAIDTDDLADSQLLRAIEYEDLEMPPSGRLPDEAREILRRWVMQKAPWSPGPPPEESATHGDFAVSPEDREHWAYQPIADVTVPEVDNRDWAENPIDRFVAARLEAKGLSPNPEATKRQLYRRAYFNALGLPPTIEQIEQFERDDRPGAYEKLVDELLSRPEYGEKWGRHWLDLVRFAETNGYERDGPKANAWRYRDYVIRAFNDDKPYDRFVLEQLAGDELADADHDSIIATGYYRLGIWDDEPADADQAFYDSLDDVVSTTSLVFTATTVGCARCHDHKIDPVPQRDYYRMLSFFRNIYNNSVQGPTKKSAFTLNTQIEIATAEERAQRAAAMEAHHEQLQTVEAEYAQLEEQVFAALSNPEKEDAANERIRRRLVAKKAPSVLDETQLADFNRLQRERSELKRKRIPELPKALGIKENGRSAPETFVLVRGNAHAPGDEVTPGFLEVLTEPDGVDSPITLPTLPDDIQSTGRRLAYANWLVDPHHPLTARVIVNRVWQHHFGRGLVRTTSDFGKYGEQPTHPQLLDYLAKQLIEHDWQLKWLHQLIMKSNTYRMASQDREDGLAADPENHLFWRYNMRRLTAEEMRDTVLSVTGELNQAMGGKSVYPEIPEAIRQTASRPDAAWGRSAPEDEVRRSVYVYVKRSVADPILSSFDAADTDSSCPVRFATTVPTQALTTLNGDFYNQQAGVFAERLRREAGDDPVAQVATALKLTLCRQPTDSEVARGVRLLTQWQAEDQVSEQEALRYFCLMALNLNEMIYID